jgi:hypothetical protein
MGITMKNLILTVMEKTFGGGPMILAEAKREVGRSKKRFEELRVSL